MAEIQLPTKGTQDSIKAETDKITSVKSDTSYIKSQFPISGGTDWSQYTIYNHVGVERKALLSTYPSYQTVVNISGEGALIKANCADFNSGQAYMRITLDNKTVFNVRVRGHGFSVGLTIDNNGSLNYPYNSSSFLTERAYVGLLQPLFFKDNLKIEISLGTIAPDVSSETFNCKYILK